MTMRLSEVSDAALCDRDCANSMRRTANMSPEQVERKRAQARAWYANLPDDRKRALRDKKRLELRERMARMTDSERDARRAEQREYYARNKRQYRVKLLESQYGITLAQYNAMFAAQGGRCKICDRAGTESDGDARLFVDHCHATGRIRGLLCSFCNSALGYFLDDPTLMARAIEYVS